jgi:hypothetical protein
MNISTQSAIRTCIRKSLASELRLVNAVCLCHEFNHGYQSIIKPSDNNCLPAGFNVFIDLRPYVGKHKRQHLQYFSPHIDFVCKVLEARINEGEILELLSRLNGFNYVETPCTEVGGLCHALLHRQRMCDCKHKSLEYVEQFGILNQNAQVHPKCELTRPFKVSDRHMRGFSRSIEHVYGVLDNIMKHNLIEKPDYRTRYMKYSGSKREHYRKCALEQDAHPIGTKDGPAIFHDGAVKWGEISARPRALLVQSVRAKGCDGVSPGHLLRTPIMIEGGYRDLYEDALHHYLHPRGHHMVASGMDLHKRGRKIRQMISPGDVVLSCDWASFDGSIASLGVVERNAFLTHCEKVFGVDKALRKVIATQNKCTIQAGPLRAQMFGNRGSGTAGTSTGNKILVLAALHYCLGPALRGRNACKLFCDGDDTLIIVPKQYQTINPSSGKHWWDSWARRLTSLGLQTKIEQCLFDNDVEQADQTVRFCRAGVIDTSRGPFLCKNPLDAMKVMTNFRRHFRGPRFLDYLQTLSVGTRDVYGDVPVLCELSTMFDVGGTSDTSLYENAGMEYMLQKHKSGRAGEINDSHRQSFWRTWNVTPSEQKRCEMAMRCAAVELKTLVHRQK